MSRPSVSKPQHSMIAKLSALVIIGAALVLIFIFSHTHNGIYAKVQTSSGTTTTPMGTYTSVAPIVDPSPSPTPLRPTPECPGGEPTVILNFPRISRMQLPSDSARTGYQIETSWSEGSMMFLPNNLTVSGDVADVQTWTEAGYHHVSFVVTGCTINVDVDIAVVPHPTPSPTSTPDRLYLPVIGGDRETSNPMPTEIPTRLWPVMPQIYDMYVLPGNHDFGTQPPGFNNATQFVVSNGTPNDILVVQSVNAGSSFVCANCVPYFVLAVGEQRSFSVIVDTADPGMGPGQFPDSITISHEWFPPLSLRSRDFNAAVVVDVPSPTPTSPPTATPAPINMPMSTLIPTSVNTGTLTVAPTVPIPIPTCPGGEPTVTYYPRVTPMELPAESNRSGYQIEASWSEDGTRYHANDLTATGDVAEVQMWTAAGYHYVSFIATGCSINIDYMLSAIPPPPPPPIATPITLYLPVIGSNEETTPVSTYQPSSTVTGVPNATPTISDVTEVPTPTPTLMCYTWWLEYPEEGQEPCPHHVPTSIPELSAMLGG